MRKLLIALVVLAVVLGIGELLAAELAENTIVERLEEATDAEASADVASFPLITGTLVTERVRSLDVTLTGLTTEEVHFDEVTIDVEGIRLPRNRLFDRNFRPTAIDGGTVSTFVSVTSLGEALGVPLEEIDPATATAELSGGTLTLEAPGIGAISAEFPDEVLPCSATGRVSSDGVRLSCSVDSIPEVVLQHLPR